MISVEFESGCEESGRILRCCQKKEETREMRNLLMKAVGTECCAADG